MALPRILQDKLALPVIASPLFIISNPDLVIAQCKGGIVGAFPALNARPKELLDAWLTRIDAELAAHRAAHPGVHGNYLKPSIVAAGLDADNLPTADKSTMNFGSGRVKAWCDVWGAGQGVGTISDIVPAAGVIERLKREYAAARARIAA